MSGTAHETIRNIVFIPGKAEISTLPSKDLTRDNLDHSLQRLPSKGQALRWQPRSRYHLRAVAISSSISFQTNKDRNFLYFMFSE